MKVYAFNSTKNGELYGFTTDKAGGNLPADLGPWRYHSEHNMNRGEPPRIAVRTEGSSTALRTKGFRWLG